MIYAILDNIMIILLTVPGLFYSSLPVFFMAFSALVMIFVTYRSFGGEKDNTAAAAGLVLMSAFSVLSGNFTGYLVFFFLKDMKIYVRVLIGLLLFISVQAVSGRGTSAALCILQLILLTAAFLLLTLICNIMERTEQRKIDDNMRMTASSVSEMHEKRLNEQLVMQNYVAERNARLVERENISRNIHNSVGHSITAAIMTLDAADMLYDVKPEDARKKMCAANDRMRGALESIRRAVRVLDEDNEELTAEELKSELQLVVSKAVMDTDILVFQNYSGIENDIKIPNDHAVFLTGALEELLTNGMKHGKASEFDVILLGDPAHVMLKISDNGHSDFDESNCRQRIESGFGIKKIRSYVEKCGGRTRFDNDNGFRALIELPIIFISGEKERLI